MTRAVGRVRLRLCMRMMHNRISRAAIVDHGGALSVTHEGTGLDRCYRLAG